MNKYKLHKLFQTIFLFIFGIISFFLAVNISRYSYPKKIEFLIYLLFFCILITYIINFICILLDLHLFNKINLEYLNINKLAHVDSLTGTSNRYSFDLLLKDYISNEDLPNIGCIAFSLINLSQLNKTKGYNEGNEIICEFSEILNDISEPYGIYNRNSGNEFILVMKNCTYEQIQKFINELTIQVSTHNSLLNYQAIDFIYGYVLNHNENLSAISQIIALSIRYMNKKNS